MDIRRVPQNMLQMVNWQKKREPGTTDITREWLTGRLDGLLYGGQKTPWGAAYKPLLIVDNFREARKNRHNENMLHRRKNGWEQGPKTEKTTKAALTFRRHSSPAVSGRAEETEQRPSNEKNRLAKLFLCIQSPFYCARFHVSKIPRPSKIPHH